MLFIFRYRKSIYYTGKKISVKNLPMLYLSLSSTVYALMASYTLCVYIIIEKGVKTRYIMIWIESRMNSTRNSSNIKHKLFIGENVTIPLRDFWFLNKMFWFSQNKNLYQPWFVCSSNFQNGCPRSRYFPIC